MSPVLLRPIREQIQHNRVIRLLQGRFRRRYSVATNVGDEPEATGVRLRGAEVFPDLVLIGTNSPRRLHGIIEVETAESVNRLEAMAEWVPFSKVRGAFYLYVPAGMADIAKRLCEQNRVSVTEIWSYHSVGEQVRFTMSHQSSRSSPIRGRETKAPARKAKTLKAKAPARKAKTLKTKTPARKAKTLKAKAPARKTKTLKAKAPARKAKTLKAKAPARKAKTLKAKAPARKAKTLKAKAPARKVASRKSSSSLKPLRGQRAKKAEARATGRVTTLVAKVRTFVKKTAARKQN